jgi:hypothetical protein
MTKIDVRKGMPGVELDKAEFTARFTSGALWAEGDDRPPGLRRRRKS